MREHWTPTSLIVYIAWSSLQVKSEFLSLLKETKGLSKSSRWSKTKDSLSGDKRYQAVESDSKREDYFYEYLQNTFESEVGYAVLLRYFLLGTCYLLCISKFCCIMFCDNFAVSMCFLWNSYKTNSSFLTQHSFFTFSVLFRIVPITCYWKTSCHLFGTSLLLWVQPISQH